MIKVNFKIKELDDQIEIIYSFLSCKNEMSYAVANYFDLNLDGLLELASEKKQKVVSNAVSSKYNENLETMQKAVQKFQEFWNKKQNFINKELFKIFGREFNFNCIAYVNLNPVWPRYLKEKAFDVNYNASKDFLLSSCVHEIIHFIWFDIWKGNFKNYKDCGHMMFNNSQKTFQGGSGAGCSAVVLNSYIYSKLKERKLNNVLFVATGALLSTTTSQQGESIPGVAYAIHISNN